MQKTFLANLGFLVAINLIIKPLYVFGIDVGVQNAVGNMYGLYFGLLNFTYLYMIVADLGIQQFNNRQVAYDRTRIRELFPNLFLLKGLLVIPFLLIGTAGAWITGYLANWQILAVIMLNQVLVSLSLFLRSNISGLGFYRTDSMLSVLDKVFMIVVCGFLLVYPETKEEFTIKTFLYAQTTSFILVCLAALWKLRGSGIFAHLKPDLKGTWPLIRKTIPFGLAVFLMTMYTRIDGVMIERLLPTGRYEASVYAGGYRLLDAANMLAFLFPPLLLPMFSRLQDKFNELVKLLKLSFSLMWTLVIIASASCYAFRNEIMDLLYVQANVYWGSVFGVLILNFFWMGLIHVFGTFVTATGRLQTANWIFFSCILLNICLNLLLIPDYKAWGAAITTFVTHGAVVVGLSIVIRKHLYHKAFLGTFLKGCVFAGIVILFNWGFSVLPGIHWLIRFLISVLLCILAAFMTEVLDRKQLADSFIRSKRAQ